MAMVTPNFKASIVNGIEKFANAISRCNNDHILSDIITEWQTDEKNGDSICAINKFMYEKESFDDFMHDLSIVKSALSDIETDADKKSPIYAALGQIALTYNLTNEEQIKDKIMSLIDNDISKVQQQGLFIDVNSLLQQINVLAAQNQQLREQVSSMGVNPVV